jgi:hypothetical protein
VLKAYRVNKRVVVTFFRKNRLKKKTVINNLKKQVMAKKIEIKFVKGDSRKIIETLNGWSLSGLKYYVRFYGHFYGFQDKDDAERFIPSVFKKNLEGRNAFKEYKLNGEWIVKEIPNTIDNFSKVHFELMERQMTLISSSINDIYFSQKCFMEFCNTDNEEIFSTHGNYKVNETELVSFIPNDDENERTYRVIGVIKRITNEDTGDDDELKYKIIVEPYIEGPRRVLMEKNKY